MEGYIIVGVTAAIGIGIALAIATIASKRRKRVDPQNDIPQ